VAYVSRQPGWELSIVSLADRETVHLGRDAIGRPAWSPDGKQIAYPTYGGVLVLTLATGRLSALPRRVPVSEYGLDWSPDGQWIAVSGADGLYVVRADGTALQRVSRGYYDGDPDWSPDGKRIAFSHSDTDDGFSYIVSTNPNGHGWRQLTEGFDDSSPTWSPDGREVVFSRRRASAFTDVYSSEIYAVQVRNRRVRRLTSNRTADEMPTVRPLPNDGDR
jgi:TolB protein